MSLQTLQNYLKSLEKFFKPFGNFIQKKKSQNLEEDSEKIREKYIDNYCQTEEQNPFVKSSPLQKVFFSWVSPLIDICQNNSFDENMLFKLPKDKSVKNCCQEFDEEWENILKENQEKIKNTRYLETEDKPNLLFKCFMNMYTTTVIIACILTAFVSCFRVGQAWVMNFF